MIRNLMICTLMTCTVMAGAVADRLFADEIQTLALIEQLDDDRYHNRQAAKIKLIDQAMAGQAQSLAQGLQHASMEVRSTVAEIMVMHRQREFGQQLKILTDPQSSTDQLTWKGWQHFSQLVGDDTHARKAFAQVCRRHPKALTSIDAIRNKKDDSADPYRISPDDLVSWTTLLTAELTANSDPLGENTKTNAAAVTQTTRIAMALSQTSMGPNLSLATNPDRSTRIVLGRLLADWLVKTKSNVGSRTSLRVAVRYQCDNVAMELCDSVLSDPRSPPSAIVTAMLTLAKSSRGQHASEITEEAFAAFLSDDRTAHVWQRIASEKLTLRTQVRDVAFAMLLNQHGQDPRQFGFAYLEADPLLGFRDYSLGFASDADRSQAHARARLFLEGAKATKKK